MPTKRGAVNWGAVLLIGSAVLVAGFAGWHWWDSRRKLKKAETEQSNQVR
jgi:uncharacterized membrane protein YidH (DUF202 family)